MSCPICERRAPKRFCPAKGENICAICCGTNREVTIACTPACPHLVAAHRYEIEHRKPLDPKDVPFPDLELSVEILRRNQELLSALGLSILKFVRENTTANDPEILAALTVLAETYRTLESGIYFAREPDAPLPRALCRQLSEFLQEIKKQDAQQTGFSRLKDSEIFRLLVFLLRVGTRETNGRPRSRAFINSLQAQFPQTAGKESDAPRIIMP